MLHRIASVQVVGGQFHHPHTDAEAGPLIAVSSVSAWEKYAHT